MTRGAGARPSRSSEAVCIARVYPRQPIAPLYGLLCAPGAGLRAGLGVGPYCLGENDLGTGSERRGEAMPDGSMPSSARTSSPGDGPNTYAESDLADASNLAAAELTRMGLNDSVARLRLETGAESGGPRGGGGGVGGRAVDLGRVREMMEQARRLIFPGFFDVAEVSDNNLPARTRNLIDSIVATLQDEVARVVGYAKSSAVHAPDAPQPKDGELVPQRVVAQWLSALPRVRAMLALDIQAAYDGDPAAEHTDEVVLCYPGLDAIFAYRIAHELYRLGVPILPRVISEQAHSRTSIDIHPGAQIGESFFIDHGSATVIGETSVIGRNVKVYQGVTLGARSFPKDSRGRAIKGLKRHPTIGDRVTIYAGAVILGGDTVIGDDCVIAGGVFVTSSVPPGHVVQQTRPELVLKPAPTHTMPLAGTRPRIPTGAGERAVPGVPEELKWLDTGAGI